MTVSLGQKTFNFGLKVPAEKAAEAEARGEENQEEGGDKTEVK